VTASSHSELILGGARSGKSRHALARARLAAGSVAFVATASDVDGDMRARIARHRAERPASFTTVEERFDIAATCRRLAARHELVLVDCLTLWVSNQMERGDGDQVILAAADELAGLMKERVVSLVAVSNDVGASVHPPTELGRRFQDLLGSVNQRVAAAADCVTLMVAGIPLPIRTALPEPRVHGRSVEAP